MKKSPEFLVFILALVLVGTGCNGPETRREYPIGEEIQENFDFQEGSYWVYERETDQEIDSVALESRVEDQFVIMTGNNVTEFWSYVRMDMHGSFRNEDFYYGISHGQMQLNGGDNAETRWEGEVLAKTGAFQGQWLGGTGTRFTELAAIFSQLDVGGEPYYGVMMVEQRDWNLTTQDNLVNIYYLAPGVGLVRADLGLQTSGPETWNLIRHSVIQ